jgi:1-acyl-sn-glycerol-3-phosphate acyltransferase
MRFARYLLAPLRIVLLLAHVIDGIAITGLVFPWISPPRRNRIVRAWSRVLLALAGARLRVTGVPLDPRLAREGTLPGEKGRLLLANHVSWIDVFAILATLPGRFVAKAEIGRWPLLGWLVTLVGTLYIERGRRHAVAAINHRVRDRLRAGESVVVFPEGTTTDGFSLLPFHSNLIAPALEVGCEIWPVALRYTERGQPTRAACFVGDMALLNSLWNILVARDLAIEVALLAPIGTNPGGHTRHHLAARARAEIARHLGLAVEPHQQPFRPAPATADKTPERSRAAASASR